MKASTFWKTVVADESDFLGRILALFQDNDIRFCVIGGQAVNAYVEAVVSLDLDIAMATEEVDRAESLLRAAFRVERFPYSLNVGDAGSDLRVQIQTDPRYGDFVNRATVQSVLGIELPVASVPDVLQGKVWAASDPTRRGSKRLKDLSDIARILESHPDLSSSVPEEIRAKLV